ncbi:MAG: T9SS type A sorting domain-containing protein [Psychroflexus halocasei]
MFKKSIYIILALFLGVNSYAQLDITTVAGDPIQDGDIFNFDQLGESDPLSSAGKLKFVIGNSSDTETINAFIEVVSISNTDGQNAQLCVQPLCYYSVGVGTKAPNNALVLAPGTDNGPSDYFFNTDGGDGQNYPITYGLKFFTVDDQGAETGESISVTYNYTPETFSNAKFDMSDLGISVMNTMVKDVMEFTTEETVSFRVYSLNGQEMNASTFKAGRHHIDFSGFASGIYILNAKNEAGHIAHLKLIKE